MGRSEAMRRFYAEVEAHARTDTPLFITGGCPSLRKAAALAVHRRSARKERHIAVESGWGFSGWESARFVGKAEIIDGVPADPGIARRASGGVVFIQNLAVFDVQACAQVLEMLDTGTVLPEGGKERVPVDVRVMGTLDPYSLMKPDPVRTELIDRLSAHTLRIPTLDERREDIADLVVPGTEAERLGIDPTTVRRRLKRMGRRGRVSRR